VALIHPHHPDSLYEVRVFTPSDLADILDTVRLKVKAIQTPEQPRTPGSIQCQYCMAKRICPEYKAHMAGIEQAIADEIRDEGFTALIRQTREQRGRAVRDLKELSKNIQVLMDQYVAMAQKDEGAIQGYTLTRKMLRSFTNEGNAMTLIRQTWGEDALYDALHISLPDLEKTLAKRLGTSKEAKDAVRRVLNPVLKFTASKYSLMESRSL
jgi:hypothetical protein